jgi:hypothetical protein
VHPAVARLVELMPPPAGGGRTVDWDTAAEQWGTRFPADYREFIELYGGGSINRSFHFSAPSAVGYSPRQAFDLVRATELGFELFDEQDEDAVAEAEGRICWALDAGANHAYWDTADADPDRWTVLVLKKHGEWEPFDFGMAQFMVHLLTGGIDLQPMALFNPETPEFQPWKRA